MFCGLKNPNTIFIDKISVNFTFYRVKEKELYARGWEYDFKRHRLGQPNCYSKTTGAFRLWINLAWAYCGMEFCPGKVLHGENIFFITSEELDACLLAAKHIYDTELRIFSAVTDKFEDGAVYRLDLAQNISLKKRHYQTEAICEMVRLLSLNPMPRRTLKKFDTGTSSCLKSAALVAYEKSAEVSRRTETLFYNIFLRFEVQFKKDFLKKRFSRASRKITNLQWFIDALKKEYIKSMDEAGLACTYQSRRQVRETILNSDGFRFNKKLRLLEFAELLNKPSLIEKNGSRAKEIFSESVYRQYFNDIKNLGIWPFWSDMLADDRLVSMKNTAAAVSELLGKSADDKPPCRIYIYSISHKTPQDTTVNSKYHIRCSVKKSVIASGLPP